MNVLAIDVGGTNIKILASGETEARKFPSGPSLTPMAMVSAVQQMAGDWQFDAISIGYPGVVKSNSIVKDPVNLGPGWAGFDFAATFAKPVKVINDAAMQALGSYDQGILLFLGLGTGLGSAVIAKGTIVPLELAHLPYRRKTYEDYLGLRGLERLGKKRWRQHVFHGVERLITAFNPDDIVLGGGNVKKLKTLPEGCRQGDNALAFVGGFRLWDDAFSQNT